MGSGLPDQVPINKILRGHLPQYRLLASTASKRGVAELGSDVPLGSSIEGEVKRKFFSLDGWSFSCFQPHVMRAEF